MRHPVPTPSFFLPIAIPRGPDATAEKIDERGTSNASGGRVGGSGAGRTRSRFARFASFGVENPVGEGKAKLAWEEFPGGAVPAAADIESRRPSAS